VDEIVPEPLGGAHTDAEKTALNLKDCLLKHLVELLKMPLADRLKKRYEKYRAYGHFLEKTPLPAESGDAEEAPRRLPDQIAPEESLSEP
jgi:hypothetical protein